jgi:serine/threonine protein kinase
MSRWESGLHLGPYVLQSLIGEGGMGEVWKARDSRLERTVAIKRLKGEHSARFEHEARAIAALNHPHICLARSEPHLQVLASEPRYQEVLRKLRLAP